MASQVPALHFFPLQEVFFPSPADVLGFHHEMWCSHVGHPLGRGSSGYSGTWRLSQGLLQIKGVIAQIAASPWLPQEVQQGGWGVVSAASPLR